MSAELVMRTVGVLSCATMLSLFTTIAAYAAVNTASLKWDGSFCTTKECGSAFALMRDTTTARLSAGHLPARAS